MGNFQPVCDIVLQYFVISVCVPSKTLQIYFILVVFFFSNRYVILRLSLFHENSFFYTFSSTCPLGFS